MTIRLPFARIAEWQGPVVRVHLISLWRAHLGDHAGHCIHRHHQQATDYLFAELPGFKNLSIEGRGASPGAVDPLRLTGEICSCWALGKLRMMAVPIDTSMDVDPAELLGGILEGLRERVTVQHVPGDAAAVMPTVVSLPTATRSLTSARFRETGDDIEA
ncbi:hypothetical protein [Streptomyces sp. NBC_00203]|uniref:hypothetical protein n=1 Tax=Streptomyces sp. NBC_00203 TaxID=2975680 RepID=UPI00324F16D1